MKQRSTNKKVLIIDKEAKHGRALKQKLNRAGFDTVEIYNSLKAFEAAHVEDPDVILLDLDMPSLNGFRLAHIFKNDNLLKHTPIIAMDDCGNKDIADAGDHGFTAVTGRCEVDEVVTRVESILKNAG